eukprot:TRINITY_DN41876_c0_g1_i1.p4 TRINITY_DN41876_c0_g1~~TRINITY_DN41876_c0_g1_i1.p4  ORF type:complete len:127 (-),score=11.99 TRINITY_DN41876_c0_g1_i1:332-712(-)
MINDMLRIVVDPYFPPAKLQNQKQNQFELIYKQSSGRNQRQSFEENLYPIKAREIQPNFKERKAVVAKTLKQSCSQILKKNFDELSLKPKESNLYESLKHVLNNYTNIDFTPFYVLISRLFSKLIN